MLDTRVVPCTKLRRIYDDLLLHFSVAMNPAEGQLGGRIGIAVCGMRDVIDREYIRARTARRVRLHELPRCERCEKVLPALNLQQAAADAVAELLRT